MEPKATGYAYAYSSGTDAATTLLRQQSLVLRTLSPITRMYDNERWRLTEHPMVKGPLADRLEYAILQVVMGWQGTVRALQDSWGGWENRVREHVPDVTVPDLKSAFKRLGKRDIARLTKPDSLRRNAYQYSGNDSDDAAFFFTGPFNVDITNDGVSYWDSIRTETIGNPIGFVPNLSDHRGTLG